jgi:hypothetical protein
LTLRVPGRRDGLGSRQTTAGYCPIGAKITRASADIVAFFAVAHANVA